MRKRIFPTPDREEILAGHPLRTMAKIGGPAVVSSLLFTLYNLADAFWIGRLPTDHAGTVMAGIQISWPFVWFIISFVAGFGGAAVSALVAQYIGANRQNEARFAFNQLFTLSVFAGVILGVIGFFLTPYILKLLIQEPNVAHEASLYLSVIFLGLPTMVLPGLFYHAYSATGDTVTPLLVNGVGILTNMILDPLLVLGWGPFPQMGILGAAYATVIAQAVAMVIFVALFLRGEGLLHIDRSALRLRWEWMSRAMKIGLPAGIGQSTVAFGFVVLMWVIGRLDNAEAALAVIDMSDPTISPIAIPSGRRGDTISDLFFTQDSSLLLFVLGGDAGGENSLFGLDVDAGSDFRIRRGRFGHGVVSPDSKTVAIMEWVQVEDETQPMYLTLNLLDIESTAITTIHEGADIVEGEVTDQRFAYPLTWRHN